MGMLITPPVPLPLSVANGGTGSATAANARTALGLGTAAVKNTGTSGDAIPLLNGANSWSLGQTLLAGGIFTLNNAANSNATRIDCPTGSTFRVRDGGDLELTWGGGVLDAAGQVRCDTLRIDAAPTAETPAATHTAVINLNGTSYKFLCLAA